MQILKKKELDTTYQLKQQKQGKRYSIMTLAHEMP